MSLLLILALYAIAGVLLAQLRRIEMSPGVEAMVNISASVLALVAPIIVYSALNQRLTLTAVDKAARKWCAENGKEFERIEWFKNHVALTYRDGSSKPRLKFRVHFRRLSWRIRDIEWLDS